MDMNLIAKPQALEIIKELGNKRVSGKVVYYELICGLDYRYLTLDQAIALKEARFKNIRIAWDFNYNLQRKVKACLKLLFKVGYTPESILVFMICNHTVSSYLDNLKKLDLCKVWGVKVGDCYYDNQLSPNINPAFWSREEIHDFRKRVRLHNQLIRFKIDPNIKEVK